MQSKECFPGECRQCRDCPARNAVDFQSRAGLHRAFAPGVLEGYRAPMSRGERIMLVMAYVISGVVACMLLGWGCEVMSGMDLSALLNVAWKN